MYENYFTNEEEGTTEMEPTVAKKQVMLSRYLYSISDIKQTLMLTIVNRDTEQSLFWAYELYFSGFQEETFDYLLDIASIAFQAYPMDCAEDNYMMDYVSYSRYLWELEPNNMHHQIGNCIVTMCLEANNLAPFIKKYFKIDVTKEQENLNDTCDTFEPQDVEKYNPSFDDKPKYKVLQHARKYAVNKTYNKLFQTYLPENPKEIYIDNWLYYASFSPIWEQRIFQFGGTIDYENQQIVFHDEDAEEEFYSAWNYDPDEQSLETQQKAMGNHDEKHGDLQAFCNQYGYKIIE